MMPLAGYRMIHHIVARFEAAPILGPLIIATSDQPTDDFICSFCGSADVHCFRGSEEDVLARFHGAAQELENEYIVRATADNPLVWEGAVAHLGKLILELNCDYISYNEYMPVGLGLEILKKEALDKAHSAATDKKHREHVTPYLYTNKDIFDCVWISPPRELEGKYRLTVDTIEDYELMKQIYERLYLPGEIIPAANALALLREEPHLALLNADIAQKRFDE
jgi:spore coat polysaccharide biosynthesis protein SpsF